MARRITSWAVAALFALAGLSVVADPASAAPDPGKLVGYSDSADGKVVPVYQYTPPTLTKAQRAAGLKRMSKGVNSLKAPPPAPFNASQARLSGPPWYAYAGGNQWVTNEGMFANCNVPAASDPYLRPDNVPSAGVQGDTHSLCEIAVMDVSNGSTRDIVEIGWVKSRDTAVCPVGSRCLFVAHWVNGVFGGWNAGFVDNGANPTNVGKVLSATCAGGNSRFGRQYFNGDWWAWFDECSTDATPGDWLGYHPGSLWGGTYTSSGFVDAFGEVASVNDSNMCSDMGNGDTPTALGAASRVGTAQLINASAAVGLGMHTNTTGHGATPQAYNAVASNTPTTTFRFGGPGWKANNTLPGNDGSC